MLWTLMPRSSSTTSAASSSSSPPDKQSAFSNGFGHDVARRRRQAGALELHRAVLDLKLFRQLFLDGRQDLFAFVHVHVRNARVTAQRIVGAAERPDVNVVHFLHLFDGENRPRHFFYTGAFRAAFQENMSGLTQDADRGVQDQ